MPMRNLARRALLRAVLLCLLGVGATAAALAAAGGDGASPLQSSGRANAAAAWRGVLGEPRPEVSVGQRVLVVLALPSLADRVAAAGGVASDREERRWTARARSQQKLFISRMGIQGAQIRPEFSYTRVLNGFSAPLDPRTIALLERASEVEGVYPVRAAFPAALSEEALRQSFAADPGRRSQVALPGFDGRGVSIALLDTGVDAQHPYLRGRVRPGIDVVGGSAEARAAPRPEDADEVERHGTQLAGILVGGVGPQGLAGVATGATVLPIRVAGWQPDVSGTSAVFSRTDQIVAGLERAVDPNDDGDAHDAARIALIGVAERFAAFADGALARAVGGATRLDTLVVAPAGNDEPAGPGFGSVAGPGGAPAALTVAAADVRTRREGARVVVRAGLDVLLDRRVPLGSTVRPERALRLPLALAAREPVEELADFFDEDGFSVVAGRAVVVRAGDATSRAVRLAARAGAAAVLVDGGAMPPGALGLDERAAVPVVTLPRPVAERALAALKDGATVTAAIGWARGERAHSPRHIAPFSSRGLAFDGRAKPELAASGVLIATSDARAEADAPARYATVSGSSAAAAAVAGAAALLAQARPDLRADELKSALVGSGRRIVGTSLLAQGTGLVDAGAAATAEIATRPAALAFPRATRAGWSAVRRLLVRNLSSRTLRAGVGLERYGFPASDVAVEIEPQRLLLRPGEVARVRVRVRIVEFSGSGPAAEAAVVLTPHRGAAARVPLAIAFRPQRVDVLGRIDLSQRTFRPSDTAPSVLTVVAGSVRLAGGVPEIQPLDRLDIELWTDEGKRIGVIARQRTLLYGRYTFAITGRDPGGARLKAGTYRLLVVAYPTGGGPAVSRPLAITIT